MIKQENVAIADVQPGACLAVAVTDDGGRVLVPAATLLTEGMLQSLSRRGIEQLVIEREELMDQAALEASRVQITQQLGQLFRKAGDGAETQALYQSILKFRLERCA